MNGGVIGRRAVPGVDGRSGVWPLQEIADARRAGLWWRDYATEVLADSPAVYWRLDETSGTTATDASGNANHGTYGSGVTLDQIPLINAGRSIVGAATSPAAVDGLDLFESTVLSVEVWTKISAAPAADRLLFLKSKSGFTAPWVIFLRANGTISANLRYQNSTSGAVIASSVGSVADGVRHQIGFAWDKGGDQKVHLYVDGSEVAVSPAWNQTIWGGNGHIAQVYASGVEAITLDEAAVFLSYLTPERFAAHYNAGAVA